MAVQEINILKKTEIKNNEVNTSADYDATQDTHLINKGILDTAVTALEQLIEDTANANKADFTIFDAVYDDAGTPAGVLGTSLTVGQYVFALETVGSFTANVLYKCTGAGAIGVATFSTVAPQEGFKIVFDEQITNPNDEDVVFKENVIYLYDADSGVWTAVPYVNVSVGVQTTKTAELLYDDGMIPLAIDVPANSQIDFVNITVAEAFNGTSAVLTVGDADDNARLVDNAMFGGNSITSYSQGSTIPFKPLDNVTYGKIVLGNKTTVNVYYAVTGASTGKAIVEIGYTQL